MAWIFFNDAMLSIVTCPGRPDHLLVRARVKGDLNRVFPDAKVETTPARDYRFRTILPRRVVAEAIFYRIFETSYGNFKAGVSERPRHDAYFKVWMAMADFQDRMAPARTPSRYPSLFDDDLAPIPAWADQVTGISPARQEPCQNKGNRRRRK